MAFRSIIASLCLVTVVAHAEDKPAQVTEKPAERKASEPGWTWLSPSYELIARYSKLSEAAKAALNAEFAKDKVALESLTIKEFNARFEKAFRAVVKDDEDKKLSSGGVPATIFSERTLNGPGRRSRTEGPSDDVRRRYENLSEAAKEKMKGIFRDNREKMQQMTDEQRRSFLESNFKRIADSDEATKGK